MPRRNRSRPDHRRTVIAQEAARLMQEHGVPDFRAAKTRAGTRLGLDDSGALPSNLEVAAAIAEHNRIFLGDSQAEMLALQRAGALRLMRELEPFSPRLVGAVLSGAAGEHSAVELHVFSDEVEAVGSALASLGHAVHPFEQRLRLRRDQAKPFPGYRLRRDGMQFDITVFPERGRGNAPLSAVDGRPMRRATAKDVESLLSAR